VPSDYWGKMNNKGPEQDPFLAMVTAKAEVDLRLSDFQPRSMLVSLVHEILRPKFSVIDYHNHLDALDPSAVLRVMDECGVERVVNITMRTGEAALRMIHKFQQADAFRFSTYGWMDWSDLHSPGFFERSVDRLEELVEHGACGSSRMEFSRLAIRQVAVASPARSGVCTSSKYYFCGGARCRTP
jgi:hypothetical protein